MFTLYIEGRGGQGRGKEVKGARILGLVLRGHGYSYYFHKVRRIYKVQLSISLLLILWGGEGREGGST